MDPRRWNKVESVFAAAKDLPGGRRAAFVDSASEGDLEVASEVKKLLERHDVTKTGSLFAAPAPAPAIETGEILGQRFRILSFVGRGGMGDVYEAADTELGGRVALKTLRSDLARDAEFLARFRREVHIARQVTHPNICRIFDLGRDSRPGGDRVYFTMEFLDGRTLSEVLRDRGAMTREEALPLMSQMAEGLAFLHDRGIVHRDFKPGNVMVVRSPGGAPRAVISDFGLARAAETNAADLSRTGQLMGTPDYMAPEQLLGQSVASAADVYAFGLVMYEMVTGRKAFAGGRAVENAVQRVVEKPSPPRQISASVTAEWENLILRCLAREPEDRPSAADIGEALAGTREIAPLGKKRHRLAFAAGAGATVLALACFTLFPLFDWPWGRRGAAGGSQDHIAVLPVSVPGGEADLGVFASGLVETITSRLSQYDGPGRRQLLVVPASEVRAQDARNAGDAKRKFGVTAAVEGTIHMEGERIRLVMTLIDTAAMRQVETIVVEEPRSNALRLQDQAVSKLANSLQLHLQPKYAGEQQSFSRLAPGAYEYYLQGRGYLQRSDQAQSLDNAVRMFERAIASDGKFAPAHSGLGEAWLTKYAMTQEPKFMKLALASATRGLELNPGLAETHIGMGRVFLGTGRYEEARKNFDEAIALDGRSHEAYQGLAASHSRLRDYAKAEATYLRAISMRPGDWTGYKQLGLFYYERRELKKAEAQFRKVIDLSPDNAQGYVNLGSSLAMQDDWAGAEAAYLRALEIDPRRLTTLSSLGRVFLERGNTKRSIEMFERALQEGSRSHLLWANLGMAHQTAGDREKAVRAFEQAGKLVESELLVNPKRAELYSRLGFYRAYAGRQDYEEPMRRSEELAGGQTEDLVRNAETLAYLGQKERAVALLRTALARGHAAESMRRSRQLRGLVDLAMAAAPPK